MDYQITVSEADFMASLRGELSFVDHGRFREILEKMKVSQSSSVVLNIEGLSSIDSAGIGMLLIAAEQAKRSSQTFRVDRPNGQVERILSLANLGDVINVAS